MVVVVRARGFSSFDLLLKENGQARLLSHQTRHKATGPCCADYVATASQEEEELYKDSHERQITRQTVKVNPIPNQPTQLVFRDLLKQPEVSVAWPVVVNS